MAEIKTDTLTTLNFKVGTTTVEVKRLIYKVGTTSTNVYAKSIVSFDENTGSSVSDKTVYYKRPYGTLLNTSKTGHTFNGWFTDETWGTEVTAATICNQVDDHTLYAKLDIDYYTVTWEDWDRTILKTESVAYSDDATPPTQPTVVGRTFDGWYGTYTNVTSNRTITATYKTNTYTVTFKDWDGATLDTQTVNYGSNATPPSNPLRTGYTFANWYGTYTNVTSDRTITATYNINTFTVTFKDWDGTTLKTQTVDYGSNATPPSNPTRTGYTFSGWPVTYTNVTSNRESIATYNINTYQVLFKDWNGTTLKTQTVNYGSNATPPANPTRTGYAFSSWSGIYTNVTSDRTITATYNINTYQVLFKDWNGATLKTQIVNYGSDATPPTPPTRTGYTFSGWSGTFQGVTSDRTITATYAIRTYTVTFKNWDGATLKTQVVNYGSNATPPSNPTRPSTAIYNYLFSSWSGTYTNVTSDRVITATYYSSFRPYVFSKPSITGILSYVVERVESPNAGASYIELSDNATVYYGDVIGATYATPESGYEVVNNSPATVTGNISASSFLSAKAAPKATAWTIRYDTPSYVQTVDYVYTNNIVCPPANTARTWLTTNYPPANYNVGVIMRINSTKKNGVFCNYYYMEAV